MNKINKALIACHTLPSMKVKYLCRVPGNGIISSCVRKVHSSIEQNKSNICSALGDHQVSAKKVNARHWPQRFHKRILTEPEKIENQHHLDFRKLKISVEDKFGSGFMVGHSSASFCDTDESKGKNTKQPFECVDQSAVEFKDASNTALDSNRNQGQKQLDKAERQADRFGLLDRDIDEDAKKERLAMKYREEEENEEEEHHIRLSPVGRRHPPLWYGKKIEEFGRLGKIREAIAVLDTWMLKRDRVMPTPFCFTVLIGILGRAGYTKKCFQLFNQMKKMGLKPQDPTYTALFNACANSPWQSDGLSRATKLHGFIRTIGYVPNLPVYHAMLKAYSKCGDVGAAFRVMDELCERYVPTAETYSFLLMACCSHSDAGFLHAIQVWRRMNDCQVTPDIFHYNLLLRAVRDCGIGDRQTASAILNKEMFHAQMSRGENEQSSRNEQIYRSDLSKGREVDVTFESDEKDLYLTLGKISEQDGNNGSRRITDGENSGNSKISLDLNNACTYPGAKVSATAPDNLIALENDSSNYPMQLSSVGNHSHSDTSNSDFHAIVSTNFHRDIAQEDYTVASNRFLILGGLSGFMRLLKTENVAPDIKTFTLLVDVIARTTLEEDTLIDFMEKSGSQTDVDFFNILIEKRTKRLDYDAAKAVLAKISQHRLYPNMQTFGCLALGCRKKADGIQLLDHMESSGLAASIEVYEILVYHSYTDFTYVQYLLQHLTNSGLSPSEKVLSYVEAAIDTARRNIVKTERTGERDSFYTSDYFKRGYERFNHFYSHWLRRAIWHTPPHPWDSFREPKNAE